MKGVSNLLARAMLAVCALHCSHALWHAYDKNKKYDESCPAPGTAEFTAEFHKQTRPISAENREKWSLFADVASANDMLTGESMYGFEEGMEAIWANQHPADCSSAKFLVSGGFESGFGSELHVVGTGLALAMAMNRVYVMIPDEAGSGIADKWNSANRWQVDTPYCKNQSHTNLECYYMPWTSCPWSEAMRGTDLKKLRSQGLHIPFNDVQKKLDRPERTIIAHLSPELVDVIPPSLAHLVDCSPIPHDKRRYWWRSITAAFLVRPNAPTAALIRQHRQDPSMRFDQNNEQCVSVYIRRGDKHLEMKIIDDETKFFDMAKRLWDTLPATGTQQPVMFVGSEDPGVMESAIRWGAASHWTVRYSDLFDRSAVSTHLNAEQMEKLRQTTGLQHDQWEYFAMILNLDAHIRCSAFVCTMRSNYCRLVDELRATVGAKANRSYADLSCGEDCIDSPKTGVDFR
ncbi:hypothetical protein B484DRAFT_446216 [Ochromonadaceae sp. CCMP2298]|nr:hypothetical protein B484DRAFT_446216 [Ochromonadaceae sp. CCMP2298]|mmetsp:Transcript_709/g.1529  ORF Transcript_709/g.1529 Transcript_709/m.1529 type:complete len:460 (+) Transcript_709:120-1499(+)